MWRNEKLRYLFYDYNKKKEAPPRNQLWKVLSIRQSKTEELRSIP